MTARHSFRALAVVGAVLLGASGTLLVARMPHDVRLERVRFAGAAGELAGKLWRPIGTPRAAVLLCHGVETNKEVMDPLAIELARRGALALTFDYGGYGESERHGDALEVMVADSAAALRLLRTIAPELRVAVIGHSMGATYAVEVARREPSVAAVVAIGNEPVASEVPPRNVLYVVGLYDAFHPLDAMLESVRESAGRNDLAVNQTSGSFGDGSARALATSPAADHGIEPLEAVTMRRTLAWLAHALPPGAVDLTLPLREPGRARAYALAFAGLCLLLLGWLASARARARGFFGRRLHLVLFGGAALLGALVPVTLVPVWADVALAALGSGSVAAALIPAPATAGSLEAGHSRLRTWAVVLGLVAACLLAGVIAGGASAAVGQGELGAAPRLLRNLLLLRPFEGLCMLRGYAFTGYSAGVQPGLGLTLLLVVEAARPGAVATLFARLVAALVRAVRFDGPTRLHGSRRTLVLALVVAALFVYMAARRLGEGWLTSETLAQLVAIAWRSLLLPLVLFVLAVNVYHRRRGAGRLD